MRLLWPSEVDALAIRQEVTVCVVSAEQYDPGFPPQNLAEFTVWLQGVTEDIPEEHRSTAEIEIDSTSSYYDSHYAHVQVCYRRPETDEEWEGRKANVMARLEEQQRQERAAYEALKRKFEDPHHV